MRNPESPDLHELLKPPYSPEDIERWKEGARRYKKFESQMGIWEEICLWRAVLRSKRSIWKKAPVDRDFFLDDIKVMFLGEKSCIADTGLEKMHHLFSEFGIKTQGYFIYDPVQAQKIIDQYPDEFGEMGIKTSKEAFSRLTIGEPEHHFLTGLLMGFPYESAKNSASLKNIYFNRHGADMIDFLNDQFKKHQKKLGLSEEDIIKLNEEMIYIKTEIYRRVRSLGWVDFDNARGSEEKIKRIEAAFRESGIDD